jgi:hypothetical protein
LDFATVGQSVNFRVSNASTIDNTAFTILSSGNVGIGQTTPTAVLHLKAGTSSANTAPLKFTSGTNLTTAEVGAMEFSGNVLSFVPSGTTRKTFMYNEDTSAMLTPHWRSGRFSGTLPVANGGTGADMSSLPNNYLVRKNSSGIYDTSAVYEAGGNAGIGVEPTNISKLDLSGQLRIRASCYTTSSLESNLLIVGNTNNTWLFTGTIPPSLFVVNRRTLNNSLARIGFNAGDG